MARSSIRYEPGRRPGQGGEGEAGQRAVGGDQDGAGVRPGGAAAAPRRAGPARRPPSAGRPAGRPTRARRQAATASSIGCASPSGHDGHGPAPPQDEGEQTRLLAGTVPCPPRAGWSGCTRGGRPARRPVGQGRGHLVGSPPAALPLAAGRRRSGRRGRPPGPPSPRAARRAAGAGGRLASVGRG